MIVTWVWITTLLLVCGVNVSLSNNIRQAVAIAGTALMAGVYIGRML